MVQEVRIPVKADVAHGVAGVGKVEDAFDEAAGAASGIGKAVGDVGRKLDETVRNAKRVTDELGRAAGAAERLKRAQAALQNGLGGSVSQSDASTFLRNFDRMRAPGGISSARLRQFGSFEDWDARVGSTFKNPDDELQHRRYVMHVGMRGTNWAQNNAPPPPSDLPPPGGGGFSGGVQRAQGMAMGFAKGALALAGIGGIAAMAGRALDMSTEESVGTDTTKRLMGSLGVDFENLRKASREAAQGLGLTYVESMRLQQQFVRVAGDSKGVNVGSATQTSANLARRFGVDPAESVQFFGTMQRLRVTGGDEQSMQKMANLIANAIDKSGYSGKADEVLAAVSDFASTAARISLSSPNVGTYASYLAGLTSTHLPGLDPTGAAGMLGAADTAIRRGGGMGDASMNFSYAALSRFSPGIDVFSAKALMAGGLAGTTRSTFGPGSVLGADYAKRGLKTPGLDDVTNLQKELQFMRQFAGGNNSAFNEMVQNHFGLSSPQQAAALANMSPAQLSGEAKRLQGEIEKTPGWETRQSIASLQSELTRVGGALQVPINSIRDMVVRIADKLAPDAAKGPQPHIGAIPMSIGGMKMPGFVGDIADAAQFGINAARRRPWQGDITDYQLAQINKTDSALGLSPGSTLRQLIKESGGKYLNSRARNPKSGAMGMAQVMPSTLASLEKRVGHSLDPYDPLTAVWINRTLMGENLKHFGGNYGDALRGYNSGWDQSKWNNPETNDYARSLMAAGGTHTGQQQIHITLAGDGHIALKDSGGKTVGHVQLKAVQKPTPAGASGLTLTPGTTSALSSH